MVSAKRRLKAVLLSLPYGVKLYYAGPYSWRMRRAKVTIVSDAEQGNKNLCVEFTTKCNYRCAYCGRADTIKSGVRKVADGDVETLKEAFRNVRKVANISSVSIGGLGEPTLHPRFSELMNFLYDEYRGVTLHMDSNFSMMTEERAAALVGKIDSITWSFNIPDPVVYAKVEGANTMMQALENFKRFMALRREAGNGKPSVSVQIFQGYEHRYGWLLKQLEECGDEFAVNFKPINNFFGHLRPIRPETVSPRETCYALLNSLNMSKDGDVYACCSGFYYAAGSEMFLGNACKDSPELIRGRLEELIKKHREQGLLSIKDCASCDIHYTMTAKNLQRSIEKQETKA